MTLSDPSEGKGEGKPKSRDNGTEGNSTLYSRRKKGRKNGTLPRLYDEERKKKGSLPRMSIRFKRGFLPPPFKGGKRRGVPEAGYTLPW